MKKRFAICLCVTAVLFAHEGSVAFRKQAGSIMVTVFGAPSPLHVGTGELSVLVQDSLDSSAVLDVQVLLTLSKAGEQPIELPATRAQAVNKLLYAAYPVLTSPGDWCVKVSVKSQKISCDVAGVITVLPRPRSILTYWPYIAFVPVGMVLFIVNQWLKSRTYRSGPTMI